MGVTPNRGYPYPDLGSPMRMTEDLQALAKAYDVDLKTIEDTKVVQRPFFRASAEARQTYGAGTTMEISYDVLEVNTGGALLDVQATMPRSRFTPLVAGVWGFISTVSYPPWTDIDWVNLSLASTFLTSESTNTTMPSGENYTISVMGMEYMTGTGAGNQIRTVFEADGTFPGLRSVMPIFTRSLTGFLVSRA